MLPSARRALAPLPFFASRIDHEWQPAVESSIRRAEGEQGCIRVPGCTAAAFVRVTTIRLRWHEFVPLMLQHPDVGASPEDEA